MMIVMTKHASGGHSHFYGHSLGESCLYKQLGGTKAKFCCVDQQVNGSVGGKIMQTFSYGGNASVPPARTCQAQLDFCSFNEIFILNRQLNI